MINLKEVNAKMEEEGYTVSSLARGVCVSPVRMENILSGKSIATPNHVRSIHKILGIKCSPITTGTTIYCNRSGK